MYSLTMGIPFSACFLCLARWNGGTWDFLRRVVPNDMLDEALSWLDEHIPPEGIPI